MRLLVCLVLSLNVVVSPASGVAFAASSPLPPAHRRRLDHSVEHDVRQARQAATYDIKGLVLPTDDPGQIDASDVYVDCFGGFKLMDCRCEACNVDLETAQDWSQLDISFDGLGGTWHWASHIPANEPFCLQCWYVNSTCAAAFGATRPCLVPCACVWCQRGGGGGGGVFNSLCVQFVEREGLAAVTCWYPPLACTYVRTYVYFVAWYYCRLVAHHHRHHHDCFLVCFFT